MGMGTVSPEMDSWIQTWGHIAEIIVSILLIQREQDAIYRIMVGRDLCSLQTGKQDIVLYAISKNVVLGQGVNMEYFKKDILYKLNTGVKDAEREKLYKEWMEDCENYMNSVIKNKKKYHKQLYQAILKGYFHDAEINNLSFVKNKDKKRRINYDIVLSITCEDKRSELIHRNILNFRTNVDLSKGYIDFGDYMYGEILCNNGIWSHDFLIFRDSEINIKCKNIEWWQEK